ncbi:MAG: adenosylmethionine decarboxylase, partial [Cyanobacteria bacterium]|nr:adenosylmethionine decarboxylase [Cyanobacteriota bacterium]
MQTTASEVSLTPSVSEVSPREISPPNSPNNPSLIHLGKHLLAEFFDCNSNVLNNPGLIEELMEKAAVLCGATVIQKNFHLFSPYGVSGVVIIAESHLAIHTWPEYGYA